VKPRLVGAFAGKCVERTWKEIFKCHYVFLFFVFVFVLSVCVCLMIDVVHLPFANSSWPMESSSRSLMRF
jgi:hypothetical protein